MAQPTTTPRINELEQDGGGPKLATSTDPGAVPSRETTTINLSSSGDFTGGTLILTKVGNDIQASITQVTHASLSSPSSAAGVVPSGFRPMTTIANTLYASSARVISILVSNGGTITFEYRDWTGSLVANTNSGLANGFNYNINT